MQTKPQPKAVAEITPKVAPRPDGQHRRRRASFGQCSVPGSVCSRKSDPVVCRDIFGPVADAADSSSSAHSRRGWSSELPRFDDPHHLGHKNFHIVKQLSTGRSGALVFLVQRPHDPTPSVLKVTTGALTPTGAVASDRPFRELYSLCRLTGLPGFGCTLCFGLARLPKEWIQLPKHIHDKVILDVRLWPQDPTDVPPLVAFSVATVAPGVPLLSLELSSLSTGELAGTLLEIFAVWQTLHKGLGDESGGDHNDFHPNNIFVDTKQWRRAPIDAVGSGGEDEKMVFPVVSVIDFDFATSDVFPEPSPLYKPKPLGIAEPALNFVLKWLPPQHAAMWLTFLALNQKRLTADSPDLPHLLTYLLVFADQYRHQQPGHRSSSSFTKLLGSVAAHAQHLLTDPMTVWSQLVSPAVEASEDEDVVGPGGDQSSSLMLQASAVWTSLVTNIGHAAQQLLSQLTHHPSAALPLTLTNLLFSPDLVDTVQKAGQQLLLHINNNNSNIQNVGTIEEGEERREDGKGQALVAALAQFRAQNQGHWPVPDQLGLQLQVYDLPSAQALHFQLEHVNFASRTIHPLLDIFIAHQQQHDQSAFRFVLTTEALGQGSVRLHADLNLTIYAPGWTDLILSAHSRHQLSSADGVVEVRANGWTPPPESVSSGGEAVVLVVHEPVTLPSRTQPPSAVVRTMDVKMTAASIEVTLTFELPGVEHSGGWLHTLLLKIGLWIALRLAHRHQQKTKGLVMAEHASTGPGLLVLNVLLAAADPHPCLAAALNPKDLEAKLDCLSDVQRLLGATAQDHHALQTALQHSLRAFMPTLDLSLLFFNEQPDTLPPIVVPLWRTLTATTPPPQPRALLANTNVG